MELNKEEQKQGDSPAPYVLKYCCRSAPERVAFLEPSAGPVAADEFVRAATTEDFKPDPMVAFHEAGHAVVGILIGMVPAALFAGAGGHVRWRNSAPNREGDVIMTIAGDFAGGMARRQEHRPSDIELSPWLKLIREPSGGFCDRCRIVRALVAEHGLDASDAVVLAAYRAAEVRTLEILARHDVRSAIRAVAAELMNTGRLTGEEATQIATRYIEPGSLIEKETSE